MRTRPELIEGGIDIGRRPGCKAADCVDALLAAWGSRDAEQVAALYGTRVRLRHPMLDSELSGPGVRALSRVLFLAFPNLTFRVVSRAEGSDVAVVEWVASGTQRGEFLGRPATCRQVEIPGVAVLRFRGDVWVEHRDYWDMAKLQRDLWG